MTRRLSLCATIEIFIFGSFLPFVRSFFFFLFYFAPPKTRNFRPPPRGTQRYNRKTRRRPYRPVVFLVCLLMFFSSISDATEAASWPVCSLTWWRMREPGGARVSDEPENNSNNTEKKTVTFAEIDDAIIVVVGYTPHV